MAPEQLARRQIDAALDPAGWIVRGTLVPTVDGANCTDRRCGGGMRGELG